MVDPFKRPNRPGKTTPNPAATQRPNSNKEKKVTSTSNNQGSGGRRGHGGGGRGGNQPPEGQPDETSPWLIQPEFDPEPTASFVEYLRWLRSPDGPYENSAKIQIMQMTEQGNYEERLYELTARTGNIAHARQGIIFQAECSWRVRVGGHRGPNKGTLLPAFDATGMPYIPSSTLRGVARTQAILENLPSNLDRSNKKIFEAAWQKADLEVARWFGHLETNKKADRAGRVIFLDAYPLPEKSGQLGGLSMDMANQIWNWESNHSPPKYKPNPNPLFSIKGAVFQVGLCPMSNSEEDHAACEQVKQWLIAGLRAGIGSQVNTGYGRLIADDIQPDDSDVFLQVKFHLEGQLIHGRQELKDLERPYKWDWRVNNYKVKGENQEYEADIIPEPEVRPIAFKSMLRYWFRALSLGVLSTSVVQEEWEPILFGAIQPQTRGWIEFQIIDASEPSDKVQGKGDPCLQQSGLLKLSYSLAAPESQEKRTIIRQLFQHLIWLMFHLGGVGQGARRPLYCRENRHPFRPPWYRGTDLKADNDDLFQQSPLPIEDFCQTFQNHLQQFYALLGQLTGQTIDLPSSPPEASHNRPIRKYRWQDVLDENCKIFVCTGDSDNGKPYALAVLHSDDLKITKMKNGKEILVYDPDLCGKAGDRSPIWIKDLGHYQVVTIFGATQNPRKKYLESLQDAMQIFPLT